MKQKINSEIDYTKSIASEIDYTKSIKSNLVSLQWNPHFNFRPVYDACVSKPTTYREAFSLMVKSFTDAGYWSRFDVFHWWGMHTNANGEALLDWKQPAGGDSLMDVGKGKFDIDTESWVKYGNNIIENDAGALKVTYVDNSNGSYNILKNSNDINTDLTVDKPYKITIKAKINSIPAGSVTVRVTGFGATGVIGVVTNTSYQLYSGIFYCTNSTNNSLITASMSAGETIWIDEWDIQEWTNATAYNAPTFTPDEGFTGNGSNMYIDWNWNPAANGVNYLRDSASLGVYILTDVAETKGDLGVIESGITTKIISRTAGNIYLNRINNGANDMAPASTDSRGLHIIIRDGITSRRTYKNSIDIYSDSITSNGVPNDNIYELCINNGGASLFNTKKHLCSFIGGKFNAAEILAISNIINTCATTMGINTY